MARKVKVLADEAFVPRRASQRHHLTTAYRYGAATGMVVVLLAIVLGATVTRANRTAQQYHDNAATYLHSVRQIISSSDSPSVAKTQFMALQKPQFERIALGPVLSHEYRRALHDKTAADQVIGTVSARLSDYSQVADFENKYQPQLAKVVTMYETQPIDTTGDASKWVSRYEVLNKTMTGIVKLSQVPPEAQHSKKDLITHLEEVGNALGGMNDAVMAGSEDAYTVASAKLTTAENGTAMSYSQIQTISPSVEQASLIKMIDGAISSL